MKVKLKNWRFFCIFLVSAVLSYGLLAYFTAGISFPFIHVKKTSEWAIGIYSGNTALNLSDDISINNPVLTARDVTDANAAFVADPFIIRGDEKWYMFFEVMNTANNQGDIGYAESQNALEWT